MRHFPNPPLIAIVLILGAVHLHAGEPQIPAALQPLAPLAGASWVADFPNGKARDTHHYSWVFNGKFLRDVHEVATLDGKVIYSGETIFAHDVETGKLVWWYWNSTGGYITGDAETIGEVLRFNGENHADPKQPKQTRSEFAEITATSVIMRSYFLVDHQWKEQFAITFVKIE